MTFDSTPPDAPSSARKVSLLAGLGGLLLGLFLGAVGTLAIVNLTDGDDKPRESDTSVASSSADTEAEVEEDEASYVPTPADFSVELTVKERTCFGSAGCNVTYRVRPNYDALQTPEGTWEITYEVSGIEDGPQIQTFKLDGDQLSFNPEVTVETASPNAEAKTSITDVVEAY